MDKNKTVIITVLGGLADVYYSPKDVEVVVLDYDNLKEGYMINCPVCKEFFEVFPETGVCTSCGFDRDNIQKLLE
jgi:hypothetical protein